MTELEMERQRLDKLTGYEGVDEDRWRMERAADIIIGKESQIRILKVEVAELKRSRDLDLLAEGHLALVAEYGLEYGTVPVDGTERRSERAMHAASLIQTLQGDLKDAREGAAVLGAMLESERKS